MILKKITKPNKANLNWDKIELLVFDCDGVLTDGRIVYDSAGHEAKNFHAHDGMGFLLLRQAGLRSAVITGRSSAALERRCQDLKVGYLFQGVANKLQCLTQLLQELGLDFTNVLYMGDDWNDWPSMLQAAISVCPADAPDVIRQLADQVMSHPGGHGAVRECIEYVLYSKGCYEQAVSSYLEQITL